MLPLLFAGILFLFLLLGALVFLACLLIPPARQYALSAALWCALWGPCSIGLMIIAGIGLVTAAFITRGQNTQAFHTPTLLSTFGWTYLLVGVLITILLATAIAWVHQAIISRLTFALFRLYAAAVSAGIGSVFGWCIGWWIMLHQLSGHATLITWGICMIGLIVGFALAAYKGADGLRGQKFKRFT